MIKQYESDNPLHSLENKIKYINCREKDHTILPTPGDPTNITLSTEDTSASPVSANLRRKSMIDST
jgi:hypothetical protein